MAVAKKHPTDEERKSEREFSIANHPNFQVHNLNDDFSAADQRVRVRGYLLKQSPKGLKLWQTRYFVLTSSVLKYFKNEKAHEQGQPPKGILNFHQVSIDAKFNDIATRFTLQIRGSSRVFNMRLKTDEEYKRWKREIEGVLTQSQGQQQDISIQQYQEKIKTAFKFWKFHRFDEAQFLSQAQTGDLILCSNKKLLKGEHDVHKVFILVKLVQGLQVLRPAQFSQGDIVLESWEEFQRYKYKKFTDVIYRHMSCLRDPDFQQRVQKLLIDLQNKPYLESVSTVRRNFKSSELAAKVYLDLELLKPFKKIEQFGPKDFSQKCNDNLKFADKSIHLDEELNIMIQERDVTASMLLAESAYQMTTENCSSSFTLPKQ